MDTETGVVTPGETKLEELLMLADALAVDDDSTEGLLATALDVFVSNPDTSTSQRLLLSILQQRFSLTDFRQHSRALRITIVGVKFEKKTIEMIEIPNFDTVNTSGFGEATLSSSQQGN